MAKKNQITDQNNDSAANAKDSPDLKPKGSIAKVEGSHEAQKRMSTAKIDLFRAYPFMGILVMSTEYYFTDQIPTLAATTIPTNTIFINERFLMKGLVTKEEVCFVLAHEILHIYLEHIGRQLERNYNPELWNIATDYCINSYLKEMNHNSLKIPASALYKEEFKEMSADEIYHKILEENNNNMQKAIEQHGGKEIGGDYNDGKQRPFDVVSNEEVSEAAKTKIKQNLAAATSMTNEHDVKNMGHGAAALYRKFLDMISPVIPWQDVLRDFIVSKSAGRYTYNHVSRRSTKHIIMPSVEGDFIDLLFGIDTSGSMSEKDLGEAMRELKAICDEFDDWRVTLLSCDTDANLLGEYISEEGDDFTTINKELIGGGGTDMNPMIDYGNDMDEEPSVMIILTDGYIPDVHQDNDIPVLVVVTSSGNKELTTDNPNVTILQMNKVEK